MNNKYICTNCHRNLYENELLVAQHPFDEEEKVYGCPTCKALDEIYCACDRDECWSKATCGTSTANGYLRVCGSHYRIEEEKEK